MESEVREVSFEEALAEEVESDESPRPRPGPPHATPAGAEGVEQPVPPPFIPEEPPEPPQVDAKAQELQDDLEILAPPVEARKWTIGEGDLARTYIQCELSVIGTAQWFKLLGEFLDEAMSGESALSLNSLLSPPTPRQTGQFQLTDFQDADMFVHALGKLLTVMPKFLEQSVCIWLDVPDYEWELVRALMRRSPRSGGMTHDMFEGILETFIDQNYSEIDRFFRVRFQRLRARWRARAREANQSRSSKR